MAIIQGNAKQGSTRGFYPKLINGSLRFNDDDSAYLTLTPTGTSGGRTKFTYSGWVKIGTLSTSNGFHLLNAPYASNLNGSLLMIDSNDEFYAQFRVYTTGSQGTFDAECYSNMKFRDPSAWYHIVFAYDSTDSTAANRMKLWVNGVSQTFRLQDNPGSSTAQYLGSEFDHNIGRWLGSSHGNTDGYMANVHFIDGQALTASDFGETKNGVWVAKDYSGTYGTNGFYLTFEDDTAVEAFNTVLYRGDGNDTQSVSGTGLTPDLVWVKNRSVGDSHVLFDSVRGFGSAKGLQSQNTAAEGTNDPSYGFVQSVDSDGFTVSQGTTGDDYVNSSAENYVAWCWDAGANNAVTGHSSVTYTGNGATQTIKGFPFTPDLLWIKQRSGLQGHSVYDVIRGFDKKVLETSSTGAETTETAGVVGIDTNGFKLSGNNTIRGGTNSSGGTYVAWAWDAGDSDPATNDQGSIDSTVKSSGDFSVITYTGVGPASAANEITVGHGLTSKPDFVIVKRRNSTGDWFAFTDIIDGSNDYLYLNQVATKGDSGNSVPTDTAINLGGSLNTSGGTYVAYAWRNVTGKQKFGTYTGNGSSTGPVVTTGFRPGFVMIKRTDGVGGWYLKDSSRNPLGEQTLFLDASDADAEATGAQVTFSDTGFQVTNPDAGTNASGGTYIYAAFAGSYSDYITDYNTDGSIDSRVKANPTTGFSIVSYTGSSTAGTIGHGLSSAPDFILTKPRTSGIVGWCGYHSSLGETKGIFLELTNAAATVTDYWNDTAPTSSVFSVGGHDRTSGSHDYIAYCWSETTGYSKFGSYSGTGSAGNAVTGLGFTPAFLMVKRTDSTGYWTIMDNTRSVAGTKDELLWPNVADAEVTSGGNKADFDSDGFTLQGTGGDTNASGGTYIYAAFADTREAAFWLDQSGNDNDWQPVNLDHNDTVADSPTNNFATLNPLDEQGSANTLSDGNLVVNMAAAGSLEQTRATMGISSGQFYWEAEVLSSGSNGGYFRVGFKSPDHHAQGLSTSGAYWMVRGADGETEYMINNSGTQGASDVRYSVGDIIMVAVDMDAGKWWVGANGTWVGDPVAGTGAIHDNLYGTVIPFVSNATSAATHVGRVNFGQQPFKYDPPE